jgi:hypothetical protein
MGFANAASYQKQAPYKEYTNRKMCKEGKNALVGKKSWCMRFVFFVFS